MTITLNQIAEMLALQDKLNSKVNELWREANCNWMLAVAVESIELLEHYGWKWWKRQDTNIPQCHLELVDIWHFILSHSIVECGEKASLAEVAAFVHSKFTRPGVTSVMFEDRNYRLDSTDTKDLIRVMAGKAAAGDFSFHLFRTLCQRVGLSDEMLYKLYIGKNVLNHFRTENGYKTGGYIKDWFGEEDNDRMMSHAANIELAEGFAEEMHSRLSSDYQCVVSASGGG